MVAENSVSNPYIEENIIDHGENSHNVGTNDLNTTIKDSNKINSAPTNINSNSINYNYKVFLIQLNLFREVSVDQEEKK